MANIERLSHTMRGKMHSANKKLSMIRSKSMERFSKRNQELIVVTPRERQTDKLPTEPADLEMAGPVLGQAVAIMDFNPNPYDREALSLRRGDVVDVIETNPNGTWRGHCNGRVGNFKFLTVTTLPDRMTHHHHHHHHHQHYGAQEGSGGSVNSVQEVLERLGLQRFLSVFILNGHDSLGSLARLDREDLQYLGISDTNKQTELLTTVSSLLTVRDSGCYSAKVESSSGSGDSEAPEPESARRSRRSRPARDRDLSLNNAAILMQDLGLTSDI